MAAGESLVS